MAVCYTLGSLLRQLDVRNIYNNPVQLSNKKYALTVNEFLKRRKECCYSLFD
jgi:hypothetical protein